MYRYMGMWLLSVHGRTNVPKHANELLGLLVLFRVQGRVIVQGEKENILPSVDK